MKFLLLLSAVLPLSTAEFGDFVDYTFECPATTTCAQVCVSTVEDCPQETSCPNGTLCVDGSCSEDGECDPDLENPCEDFECTPVACNRLVRTYDVCVEEYTSFYEASAECGYGEAAVYDFDEIGFVIVYIWVVFNVLSVILWCYYK